MKTALRWALFLIMCFPGSSLWSQEKAAKDKKPPARTAKRQPPPGDDYEPGPDSKRQPGVPSGKQFQFKFENSKIYPGTSRTISVYVPAQYNAEKPACVYIGLDSLGFLAPTVFDNLIHKGEMPVTIGIGISSGTVPSSEPPKNPRFNRSFEFDGLNGDLARFVLEEVLPEVERHKTPDGLTIKLSQDPNDRCTGGGSTGGIGAFTLAWERPDAFRRVFTAIGTFVGMRGGDRYPVLVRKTEPKPIRIFMQDGSSDQWGGGPEVGDWWISNQAMQRALEFAGYQVEHVWGTGPHSGRHATAIFPDAMRWLWKDWPKPVEASQSENHFLMDILEPGQGWQAVGAEIAGEILSVNREGKVSAAAGEDRTTAKAPSGDLYVCERGELWLVDQHGKKRRLDEGLYVTTSLAVSPDGLWLAAVESDTHWGYNYRIDRDGSLADKQKFYWFHVPDWADDAGVRQLCMDRDGRMYAATRMGVQVMDRNGRSRAILPVPGGEVAGVCFGGEKFDLLHVASGDKVYARKMKVPGVPPGSAALKLPPWGGG